MDVPTLVQQIKDTSDPDILKSKLREIIALFDLGRKDLVLQDYIIVTDALLGPIASSQLQNFKPEEKAELFDIFFWYLVREFLSLIVPILQVRIYLFWM